MGKRACFEGNVATGKALGVAEKALLAHPADPSLSATEVITDAVAEAFPFPCP